MSHREECSHLMTNGKCKNGFFVSAPCMGICTDTLVPMCCSENDDYIFRFFPDGKPKHISEDKP